MEPTIKVTAKQIRFLLSSGRAWMVQPLHVPGGVPAALRGYYAVPLSGVSREGVGPHVRSSSSVERLFRDQDPTALRRQCSSAKPSSFVEHTADCRPVGRDIYG